MTGKRLVCAALAAALIPALVSGCAPRERVAPEPPLLTAALGDLVDRLRERERDVQDLQALVSIRAGRQPAVPASLSYARRAGGGPPSFRVKGFSLLGGTIFDLAADGDQVKLKAPGQEKLLERFGGSEGNPEVSGLIGDFRRVLSAAIGPWIEAGEIPVLEEEGALYAVRLIHVEEGKQGREGRISKRLWFERSALRLIRIEFTRSSPDDTGGASRLGGTVVELLDYRPRTLASGREIDWPDRIVVSRTKGKRQTVALSLEFQEILFNRGIPPGEFSPS